MIRYKYKNNWDIWKKDFPDLLDIIEKIRSKKPLTREDFNLLHKRLKKEMENVKVTDVDRVRLYHGRVNELLGLFREVLYPVVKQITNEAFHFRSLVFLKSFLAEKREKLINDIIWSYKLKNGDFIKYFETQYERKFLQLLEEWSDRTESKEVDEVDIVSDISWFARLLEGINKKIKRLENRELLIDLVRVRAHEIVDYFMKERLRIDQKHHKKYRGWIGKGGLPIGEKGLLEYVVVPAFEEIVSCEDRMLILSNIKKCLKFAKDKYNRWIQNIGIVESIDAPVVIPESSDASEVPVFREIGEKESLDADLDADLDKKMSFRNERKEIKSWLNSLPPKQKEVTLLFIDSWRKKLSNAEQNTKQRLPFEKTNGQIYREICKKARTNPRTVRNQIWKALNKLGRKEGLNFQKTGEKIIRFLAEEIALIS